MNPLHPFSPLNPVHPANPMNPINMDAPKRTTEVQAEPRAKVDPIPADFWLALAVFFIALLVYARSEYRKNQRCL